MAEPPDSDSRARDFIEGSLRQLFFALAVRPLLGLGIGLNVHHRERLPRRGPAILVANHNSHLDVFVLISLFPQSLLRQLRPVAAADYFLRNPLLAWFAVKIVGILPLERRVKAAGARGAEDESNAADHGAKSERGERGDALGPIHRALETGQIVIIFPEGSRGEPERLQRFKNGIAHLAQLHPNVPIHPVFLHGTGKALPKGEALLVPFFCDVFAGEPLRWEGDRRGLMDRLQGAIESLAAEGRFEPWT